ncbi:hypothetical protein [Modestobacter sp. SSW1-42]|uniref:hypothetical protein n=1 Tax=Modestobacter sp. SSW1-42 TaxID=596372 RepID=UPI0039886C3B
MTFGLVYLWGAILTSYQWVKADTCWLQDERYEPETAEVSNSFPFKNTCNADYDLVPTWINPTVAGIGAVSLISLALLVTALVRRRRTLAPTA